jgi:hypothetical protein
VEGPLVMLLSLRYVFAEDGLSFTLQVRHNVISRGGIV